MPANNDTTPYAHAVFLFEDEGNKVYRVTEKETGEHYLMVVTPAGEGYHADAYGKPSRPRHIEIEIAAIMGALTGALFDPVGAVIGCAVGFCIGLFLSRHRQTLLKAKHDKKIQTRKV